ncbi:hypothetical protein RND81_05G103700 [Saponaria officinalis]|uniref:F-box/LRR-repeat protein 12 n=1 Tax=Saponaria officinalis TaxID=3572 RepID=A0AAW1KRS1_SAPOF
MEDVVDVSLSTITDFPDDCLVFIFKRLSCESDRRAFGLTCRKWLEIQNQNCHSLQFDCSSTNFMFPLSGTFHKIDTHELHRILTRFPNLKSLSLSGCTELPDSGLKPLQNYGYTLRALHLDCCFKITDNGLSFLATGCPSLTFISLYRCNVTDTGLETLANGCFGLEAANLSYCSFITDHGIRSLVENCSKLTAIRISHCEQITGVGFQHCSENLAYVEAESCKLKPEGISAIVNGVRLKYLNISSLRWTVCGDGLSVIGGGLGTRLRVLNTRLCQTIRDESVEAIAKGCPSLVEWNLAMCHEVRVGGWESIALNCHNLEKLHVNRCRNLCDRGLQALENGCKKLSTLYMNGCPRVSGFAVDLFRLARGDVIVGEENMELPSDFRAIMYPSC